MLLGASGVCVSLPPFLLSAMMDMRLNTIKTQAARRIIASTAVKSFSLLWFAHLRWSDGV